jgi:hypothetical protein
VAIPEWTAPVPPHSTTIPAISLFLRRLFEQLVLERSFEIAEAGDGRVAGLVDMGPAVAYRNAEIFGNALRELAGYIQFLRRRYVSGPRPRHGRQRHLVRDAGIIGRKRCWKKSGSNKAVGEGRG